MGVEKKRYLSQLEADGLNEIVPDSFPGKVIPGGQWRKYCGDHPGFCC